jgi:hypothetical protein
MDVCGRVMLSRREAWKNFWVLHEATPLPILLLASLPCSLIFSTIPAIDLTALWVAYVRLLKTLRFG